jgi:ABC-type glycerol-3-phosphate transport system permease component
MRTNRTERIITHAIIIAASALVFFPLLWMVLSSFKLPSDIFESSLAFWPNQWSLQGYQTVFSSDIPFTSWLRNGLFIAGAQTLGQIVVGVLAAYAFARYTFPGRNLLFYFVLATMIIPEQVLLVPRFLMVNQLDWTNTFEGVIIPNIASGFAIFFSRSRRAGWLPRIWRAAPCLSAAGLCLHRRVGRAEFRQRVERLLVAAGRYAGG